MKILSVFYIPSGGVETLARQRSLALKRQGAECHFLYYEHGSGFQNITDKAFIMNDDPSIQQLIVKEKYDVIIVNSDFLFLPRIRKLGYTGILLYEVQGLGSLQEAEHVFKHSQPYVHQFADAVLYPRTPHLMQLVQRYFPNHKKFCFHNCLDTKQFTYISKHMPIEPHTLVGWIGRLEENKNWRSFLEICANLLLFSKNLRFWIFTDDSLNTTAEKAAFYQRILDLDLQNYISILSNVPHNKMPYYYTRIGNSGGFLCSTSKVEGFGYAMVEAMSCLCPVITSDSDSVRSFIFHNNTGKIFPQNSEQQAVNEAIELLSQPALKQTIRQQGQRFVQEHFSLEKYAANFMQMIRTLQGANR